LFERLRDKWVVDQLAQEKKARPSPKKATGLGIRRDVFADPGLKSFMLGEAVKVPWEKSVNISIVNYLARAHGPSRG
jgi:hypothetical protein